MEQLEVIKITEDAKSLIILDQTQLPNHEEYLTLQTKEEMWKAIKLLQVRICGICHGSLGTALSI